MRKNFLLILGMLVCCSNVYGMGGHHDTKPVTMSDSILSEESSQLLTDLMNRPERVDGYWINSNDWFYFAGDTEKLNDFLQKYAKLTETPHLLIIHSGKAPAEKCFGDHVIKPYSWKIDSIRRGFTREQKWFQKPDGGQWRRVVVLQIWLGDNIELDKLKVPKNVEVRSGGEIQKFIERHNQKATKNSDCKN